jgi:formylglycine-generating enzyme required for sulfatase activity
LLAKTPVRNAWLRHEAVAASPRALLAAGLAIVDNGRRVMLPQLLADVHEVSNQQYRYCVQAQQCAAPAEPANDAHFARGDRTLPVVFVTAYDAVRFCFWLGRRLPTETEWERIARGTSGAKFPWGNATPKPDQVNAVVGGHHPSGLIPVDSAAVRGGRSRDGIEQLIGNVREWTATRARYNADGLFILQQDWNEHGRVLGLAIIGGSYQDLALGTRASFGMDPSTSDYQTGFRCVATA